MLQYSQCFCSSCYLQVVAVHCKPVKPRRSDVNDNTLSEDARKTFGLTEDGIKSGQPLDSVLEEVRNVNSFSGTCNTFPFCTYTVEPWVSKRRETREGNICCWAWITFSVKLSSCCICCNREGIASGLLMVRSATDAAPLMPWEREKM